MAEEKFFLIGYGERLTKRIPPPSINPQKHHPYTIDESIERLEPLIKKVGDNLGHLPDKVCPNDEAVAILTLHPAYIAKSYFPENLFKLVGLKAVGSRPTIVKPEKWKKKSKPTETPTIDIFVAGKRERFYNWPDEIKRNIRQEKFTDDLRKIEDIRTFYSGERIKSPKELRGIKETLFEIALHAGQDYYGEKILYGFQEYLEYLKLECDFDRRIYAKGLCFLPLKAPRKDAKRIEQFSFLRVLREMPKLRIYNPVLRRVAGKKPIKCKYPKGNAIDHSTRVAIFDGGVSPVNQIKPWVKRYTTKNLGKNVYQFEEHGTWVTSSYLFGPIDKDGVLPLPYTCVDHYRVLDINTQKTEDLFDVLHRIVDVLQRGRHKLFNLSIGPYMPIEDDEVHVWTAKFDEILSSGKFFGTIAVGNDGELDYDSGNARIQVPSDCVNGIAVGACDLISGGNWRRASYSCRGPGRSPGIIKPDLVAFGGTESDPFFVIDPKNADTAVPICGTSFSSPLVLRLAAGVKAMFGDQISEIGIKALLIHRCCIDRHRKIDVGWGRVPHELDELILCSNKDVTVIYQGELEPSKYIRAEIPMPRNGLNGMVELKATFCYATDIDPQDPSNYTRSGLEVRFRPKADRFSGKDPQRAKTKSFFQPTKLYANEYELRSDAHKWETVLHSTARMRSSSLLSPIFDIHYNARTSGSLAINPRPIPYSLVVSISAPKTPNLYNNILTRYRTQLEALEPLVDIPVRVSN